jgi:hypothetical protein
MRPLVPLPLACALFTTAAPATHAQSDGNWPLPARDYASTRFSPLDRVAFTFSTSVSRGRARLEIE